MKFRNPTNGHIEERNLAALWALLFGGFYFIANGLFIPLIIWILIAAPLYVALGPAATVIMLIVNIVFAAMAGGMIRASYLRKGWVELTASDFDPAGQVISKTRKCPFCAEEILAEAVKCKHCKSDVPALAVGETEVKKSSILDRPDGMSIGEWQEKVIAEFGVSRPGGSYFFEGTIYPSFASLIEALKAKRST